MGMNAPVTITGAVPADIVHALDRLAGRLQEPREQVVARAVEEFVARENELIDLLDAAEQQIERGDFLTQEQMERWFAERTRSRT